MAFTVTLGGTQKGGSDEWHCRDHETDSFGAILRDIHATGGADRSFPSHANPLASDRDSAIRGSDGLDHRQ